MISRTRPESGPADRTVTPPDGRAMAEQPRWRQDFPIDAAQDDYVSRRELAKFVVLTSAAFVVGQWWIVVKSLWRTAPLQPAVRVAAIDELPVGGAKTFTYPAGSTPRLLVRTGEHAFVAYDQQCTHLLCPVVPDVPSGRLHCPCHNGWFDLQTGQVLAGPPQRALPRVHVEVRADGVYATGVDEAAT